MTGPEVRELVLEHRLRANAVAELVADQVRDIARRADPDNIDAWFAQVVDDLVALIAAAFEALRRMTQDFLVEHADLQGVDLVPVPAEWITEQVRTSLRTEGPVGFKASIDAGADPADAVETMATRLAGSSQRLTMEGERRTVEDTVDESDEIVGWRRVSDGDPCHWCAMLISRGSVYKTAESAGLVVGRNGKSRNRKKTARKLGESYHDWDGCSVVPLYAHEEEPEEVQRLQDLWEDVTKGKAGRRAINAWRQYWEGQRQPVDPEELLSDAEPLPDARPEPPQRMDVPAGAEQYHRDVDGLEDIVRAVESGEFDERPLTGGVSADTRLATAPDGTRLVRKIGGNPAAEQAVSLIGRALGLRAPRVYRDGPAEVWMEFIDDAQPWDVLAARGADPGRRNAAIGSDDGKLVGLLDILVNNGDRNGGNWMLTDDGQVVPIDHGHAFAVVPNLGGRPRPVFGGGGPFAEQYWDASGNRPGPHDLTPYDVEVVQSRLEALRPDFALIDRTLWLDYALAVLKAVAPHARGTRDLVGVAR